MTTLVDHNDIARADWPVQQRGTATHARDGCPGQASTYALSCTVGPRAGSRLCFASRRPGVRVPLTPQVRGTLRSWCPPSRAKPRAKAGVLPGCPAYDGYCAPWARRRFGLPRCGQRHVGRRHITRLAAGRFADPAQGDRAQQDRGPREDQEAPGRGGCWAEDVALVLVTYSVVCQLVVSPS